MIHFSKYTLSSNFCPHKYEVFIFKILLAQNIKYKQAGNIMFSLLLFDHVSYVVSDCGLYFMKCFNFEAVIK